MHYLNFRFSETFWSFSKPLSFRLFFLVEGSLSVLPECMVEMLMGMLHLSGCSLFCAKSRFIDFITLHHLEIAFLKQPCLLILLCCSSVSLWLLHFPVMATHWENGEQRHFIEMFSFERLEEIFLLAFSLHLNGRQHSKRSEEPPVPRALLSTPKTCPLHPVCLEKGHCQSSSR